MQDPFEAFFAALNRDLDCMEQSHALDTPQGSPKSSEPDEPNSPASGYDALFEPLSSMPESPRVNSAERTAPSAEAFLDNVLSYSPESLHDADDNHESPMPESPRDSADDNHESPMLESPKPESPRYSPHSPPATDSPRYSPHSPPKTGKPMIKPPEPRKTEGFKRKHVPVKAPLPSPKRPRFYLKREWDKKKPVGELFTPPKRKIHGHKVAYVLALREGEYVLTDGRRTVMQNNARDWKRLLEKDLNNRHYMLELYPVDVTSSRLLKEATKTFVENHTVKSLKVVKLEPKKGLAPCTFCQKPDCLVWLAIKGGIQRFVGYPIDVPAH